MPPSTTMPPAVRPLRVIWVAVVSVSLSNPVGCTLLLRAVQYCPDRSWVSSPGLPHETPSCWSTEVLSLVCRV
jgi:hypothetical protein